MKKINAVLVKLSIPVFPNKRTNTVITEEVREKKKLDWSAGEWKMNKLPPVALAEIAYHAGQVRQFHYAHTCIWEDGQRLLGEKARDKYDETMTKFETRFWSLVDTLGERYEKPFKVSARSAEARFYFRLAKESGIDIDVPDVKDLKAEVELPSFVAQAKIMHKETFEPADFPSWGTVRGMFGFVIDHSPVPHPEHFNPEMQKLYSAGLEAITEKKLKDAVADAWKKLFDPVLKMAETLNDPDTIFRDTLIGNVGDIVATAKDLNIADDPNFVEAVDAIQKELTGFQPDLLRKDKVARKDAAEKAKGLAERFGALGSARKMAD